MASVSRKTDPHVTLPAIFGALARSLGREAPRRLAPMGAFGRFCFWVVDNFQPHQMSIFDVFRLYGSVLPRTAIYGVIGALEGGIMKHYNIDLVRNREIWQHPYALHVIPPPLPSSPAPPWGPLLLRSCKTAAAPCTSSVKSFPSRPPRKADAVARARLARRSMVWYWASHW